MSNIANKVNSLPRTQTFKGLLVALLLASGWCFLATQSGSSADADNVRLLVSNSAGAIADAQHIKNDLAQMNATVAETVARKAPDDGKLAGEYIQAKNDLDANVIDGASRVSASGANSQLADAVRLPLQHITHGIGAYEAQRAKVMDELQAGDLNGAHRDFQTAAGYMQQLIGEADMLDQASTVALNKAYQDQLTVAARATKEALVPAVVLLLVLLVTLAFNKIRLKRRLNAFLAAALVLGVAYVGYTAEHISAANSDVHAAMDDAFDSEHILWNATSDATSLKQSALQMVINRSTDGSDTEFSHALFSAPQGFSVNQAVSEAAQGKVNFDGLLANELSNVKFEGEKQSALEALRAYGQFQSVVDQIKHSVSSGNVDGAAYDIGRLNSTYDQLAKQLGQTKKINDDAFVYKAAAAQGDLGGFGLINPAFALLIAACAVLGLKSRLGGVNA